MAALTKEQWLAENQKFLHGDAVLYLVDKVWEAATALAVEKFTAANNARDKICPGSGATCQSWCVSRFCAADYSCAYKGQTSPVA